MANRGSGSGSSGNLVRRLVRELGNVGLETEVAWTPAERRCPRGRGGRGSGCRCLVAVGGDGTVSALVNEQPRVPITVLPAGTENLAAQHFGLRRNPACAGPDDRRGPGGPDWTSGCAAGRRFLLMTGFGFDGDVVTRHHRSRTSASGRVKPTHRAAYVEPILRSSLFYRFPPISVRIEDPGARRARRDDGLRLQPAALCPGPAVRPPGQPGRRPARPGRLPRAGAVPGALLPLARLPRHASRPSRASSIAGSGGCDSPRTSRCPSSSTAIPRAFCSPGHGAADRRARIDHQQEPARDWTIEVIPGAVDVLVPPGRDASPGGSARQNAPSCVRIPRPFADCFGVPPCSAATGVPAGRGIATQERRPAWPIPFPTP